MCLFLVDIGSKIRFIFFIIKKFKNIIINFSSNNIFKFSTEYSVFVAYRQIFTQKNKLLMSQVWNFQILITYLDD